MANKHLIIGINGDVPFTTWTENVLVPIKHVNANVANRNTWLKRTDWNENRKEIWMRIKNRAAQ